MNGTLNLLLVEDDTSLRQAMEQFLSLHYFVFGVSTLLGARSALRSQPWDAVLLDLTLPDGSGFDLFSDLLNVSPRPTTIVLTGSDDLALAQRAIDAGAEDYVVKTGSLIEELLIRIPMRLGRGRRFSRVV